jgi:hypothetical protein
METPMTDAGKATSWWSTLPGIITTVTATLTALTGLIVAINQTGWLGPRTPPAVTTSSAPAPSAPPGPVAAVPSAQAPPRSTSPLPSPGPTSAVGLPALRDYRLGDVTFTLRQAEVAPRTSEKDTLQVRLRLSNHQRTDANFWDSSFRLIVDGVPVAPVSGLNEVVAGQAAKEGDVVFVIPRGTTGATLKITHANDSTAIPLQLNGPTAPQATSPLPPPRSTYAVALPALRDYRLGKVTFTLLQAEVTPRTTEKDGLHVRLRLSNHQRTDANFWDSSFRLIVDGVPVAPASGLNEVVPGQAAKDGDVLFVIPHGTTGATLKITHANDNTEIPLQLKSPH